MGRGLNLKGPGEGIGNSIVPRRDRADDSLTAGGEQDRRRRYLALGCGRRGHFRGGVAENANPAWDRARVVRTAQEHRFERRCPQRLPIDALVKLLLGLSPAGARCLVTTWRAACGRDRRTHRWFADVDEAAGYWTGVASFVEPTADSGSFAAAGQFGLTGRLGSLTAPPRTHGTVSSL